MREHQKNDKMGVLSPSGTRDFPSPPKQCFFFLNCAKMTFGGALNSGKSGEGERGRRNGGGGNRRRHYWYSWHNPPPPSVMLK